jgi:hypothetical protein
MIAPVPEGGRTPDAFDAFAMKMRMERGTDWVTRPLGTRGMSRVSGCPGTWLRRESSVSFVCRTSYVPILAETVFTRQQLAGAHHTANRVPRHGRHGGTALSDIRISGWSSTRRMVRVNVPDQCASNANTATIIQLLSASGRGAWLACNTWFRSSSTGGLTR